MDTSVIKKILLLYNQFDKENPISASFSEHAESDDWNRYWQNAADFIQKNLNSTNNDLVENAISKLQSCQKNTDAESAHSGADYILCRLLHDLGYSKVVNEYNKVEKWYS